jgi:hypothetical protein
MSTPIERNSPLPEDFMNIAKLWHSDAERIIFESIWGGFDKLREDGFPISGTDDQIEISISQAASFCIEDYIYSKSPKSKLRVFTEPIETSNHKIKRQPPRSDIGFRLIAGQYNSHFTLEAKIIWTDGAVSKYIKEVTDNFLTGRYSKYSSVGGMLGYLMSGTYNNTFTAISKALNCSLTQYEILPHRPHKISEHHRQLEDNIDKIFTCHHLIIKFIYNE